VKRGSSPPSKCKSTHPRGKMVNQNARRPVQEDDGLSEFNFFREDIVTSTMDPARLCEAAVPFILHTSSSTLCNRVSWHHNSG
jgi:hypothetical protein